MIQKNQALLKTYRITVEAMDGSEEGIYANLNAHNKREALANVLKIVEHNVCDRCPCSEPDD
jgi:hypothetical protein